MTTRIVAAAQLGPASPAKVDTVARIARLIERAGAEGAALVVFPELALTPYFAAAVHEDVTPFFERELHSPETEPIFAAIAAAEVEVVLPFAEQADAALYNSAALIGAGGVEIGRYRKMHIPGHHEPQPEQPVTFLEKRYFAPGDLGFPVYEATSGRVGMLICYDRRFPEAYRCLALGGAEIIAIGFNEEATVPDPDAAPAGARWRDPSEVAMRAGAHANGVYVIAAGKGGVEGGMPFIGGSIVIDPTGEVLARSATDGDELVLAEIDLEAARRLRTHLDLATNRRPESYGILSRTPLPA